jgi:hypothetical protein
MSFKIAFVFSFLSIFFSSFAQKDVYLTISHKIGELPFAFNQEHTNNLGQTFTITRMDYYISSIKIIHDGGQVIALDNSKHILVKASANIVDYLGQFDVNEVEAITFSVGVHPSLNNADPALQDPGSPLYFQTPTMHWGWTSGYFFACIEGIAGVNFVSVYQLHGLWNGNYFEQTVEVVGVENETNQLFLHLNADYKEALRDVNVVSVPQHHGSDLEDLKMLQNFRDYVFSAGTGELLSLDKKEFVDFQVYPNPTNGILSISCKGNFDPQSTVYFYDGAGTLIKSVSVTENMIVDLSDVASGIYYLFIESKRAILLQQKVIVN